MGLCLSSCDDTDCNSRHHPNRSYKRSCNPYNPQCHDFIGTPSGSDLTYKECGSPTYKEWGNPNFDSSKIEEDRRLAYYIGNTTGYYQAYPNYYSPIVSEWGNPPPYNPEYKKA